MEKVNLIKSVLNGETPSRTPYGFWTHFPRIDLEAEALADTTYSFYKELGLDFIKSMPNGMFSIQDWGCECDFSQIPNGGVARVVRTAVTNPEDWNRLETLDLEKGSLGRELFSLKLLLQHVNNEAPVIATVFSPMTTAHKLSGGKVLDHLKTHPEEVKSGLHVITETTCRFVEKVVELGCAGIFLATQLCSEEMMTHADYCASCKPYDLAVLDAVNQDAWFNVAHIHGNRILFDAIADYPVHAVSWHIWETPPSVAEFKKKSPDKIIVGGFQRAHISAGNMDAVYEDLENMLRLTGGSHLILAPGCTIRHPCNRSLLKSIASRISDSAQAVPK